MTRTQHFIYAEDTAAFGLLIGEVEQTARRLREHAANAAQDLRRMFRYTEEVDAEYEARRLEDRATALSALELQLARACDAIPSIPCQYRSQLPITQEEGEEEECDSECITPDSSAQRANAMDVEVGDLVEVGIHSNKGWHGVYRVTKVYRDPLQMVEIINPAFGKGTFRWENCRRWRGQTGRR